MGKAPFVYTARVLDTKSERDTLLNDEDADVTDGRDGRVLAGMNVNVWDVAEEIERIVRAGAPVDPARLEDPAVPLSEL